MIVYVLEFDRTRIEFLKLEEAIEYAKENDIKAEPFEYKKEIIEPNIYGV